MRDNKVQHTCARSPGIFSPTSSATLPNARLLSETLMDLEAVSAQQRTLAVMTWGQFMDHDLAHTPIFQLGGVQWLIHSLPAAAERWMRSLFKYIARRSQQLHVP